MTDTAQAPAFDLSRESGVALELLCRSLFSIHVLGDPKCCHVADTILAFVGKDNIESDTVNAAGDERVVRVKKTGAELVVSRALTSSAAEKSALTLMPFAEMYPSIVISNEIEYSGLMKTTTEVKEDGKSET